MATVLRVKTFVLVVVAALSVSSCSEMTAQQRQALLGGTFGVLAGGAAGAALGGEGTGLVVGALAGALLGGFLGYEVASLLTDDEERELYQVTDGALETAPPSGGTTVWSNPEGTKTATVQVSGYTLSRNLGVDHQIGNDNENLPSDAICRHVQIEVHSEAETASEEGVYCRNSHGDYIRI